MADKPYPPIINETLPAFYLDEKNGAVITVPFLMNRAASQEEGDSFIIKIKTVQNNIILGEANLLFENEENFNQIIKKGIAKFSLSSDIIDKIKIGQFLKVQMAQVTTDDLGNEIIGYYSTVSIIKYTTKPEVYIQDFEESDEQDSPKINTFKPFLIGICKLGEDKTERIYSYNFSLYKENSDNAIPIATSGWLLYNNNSESSLTELKREYFFNYNLSDGFYYLQFKVKTINNLEVSSPLYECAEAIIDQNPELELDLIAKNVFSEGYIQISFDTLNKNFDFNSNGMAIEFARAEEKDKYNKWEVIKKEKFLQKEDVINWSFKDYAIEQGTSYKYSFRQYNKDCYSRRIESKNIEQADFEDIFLWDGLKQLKIRFNPKVTSFKINRQESKIDTLGSKYPFIFRNGIVEYKEFPISGLISYHLDENEEFLKDSYKELGIVFGKKLERLGNSKDLKDNVNQQIKNISTTNLENYNIKAERKFKLKILNWLNNGEIKLFKSPSEGNYFVRLMNVSLSPEDKLNRMIHNFSCSAYEVMDYNYNNLINLNYYNLNNINSQELETFTIHNVKKILFKKQYKKNSVTFSTQNTFTIVQNKMIETIIGKQYSLALEEDEDGKYTEINFSLKNNDNSNENDNTIIIKDLTNNSSINLNIFQTPTKKFIYYLLPSNNYVIYTKNNIRIRFPIIDSSSEIEIVEVLANEGD